MNDVNVTYSMVITQSGGSISIVLNVYESSWITDAAYWNEYEMSGVPPVGFNSIGFTGTVSGASFTADEVGGSSSTEEHIAGTFTTDIITATLTGYAETTDTNGIIVLRGGSSATMPPFVTATPTPTATPAPAPALPTAYNLGSVSLVQGSALFADTGAAVTTQSQIVTGAEIQTGSDAIVSVNYPDQGGTLYLGSNSDAAWEYPEPQLDALTGNTTYTIVPSQTTNSVPFETGLPEDPFGQATVTLPIEVGVAVLLLGETLPAALAAGIVVEGIMMLPSGIAYIHEQLSPQGTTYDVRSIDVPQGLVMGDGTDYVVTVTPAETQIQVISGSAIFVDQYTNSSITVTANQMLTLPSGVQTGFSPQDLQSDVSAFDASSVNQWWITAPVVTTAPTDTPIAATPTTKTSTDITSLLSSPIFLAVIVILVVIIAIAAVRVAKGRKTHLTQPGVSNQNSSSQNAFQSVIPPPAMSKNPKTTASTKEIPPPPPSQPDAKQTKFAFCPNCGNQLPNTKSFCPFCGFDLRQLDPNDKK
jgi:hypothetical protein